MADRFYGHADHHRKDVRIEDIVIIISIEDEAYETIDWSFGGFKIGGYRGNILTNSEFMIDGVGPDLDTIFAVRVDCKAIRVADGMLSASYVEIDSDVFDVLEALMTRRQTALEKVKKRIKHYSLASRFIDLAAENLEKIYEAFWKLNEAEGERTDELAAVYRAVDKLKRQSAKVDYTLATEIGDELCRFVDKLDKADAKNVEAIKLHIDALRMVVNKNIRGSGGTVGAEILDGLQQVRDRLGA